MTATSEVLRLGTASRPTECTLWKATGTGRSLIVAPAMGVPRRFYDAFAEHHHELGYSVLSLDYFGMQHRRGGYDSPVALADWGSVDLKLAIAYAADRLPGPEVFLVGHSIAGQVLPLAANRNELTAVFLVASQNVSKRHWHGPARLGVELFWRVVIPLAVGLVGYLPGFAYGGRYPLHRSIALDWRRGGLTRNGLLEAIPAARAAYEGTTVPTKFVSLEGDDLLAPRQAVAALATSYGSPVKEHVHLDERHREGARVGHFDFFRSRSSRLWPLADRWFREAAIRRGSAG